MAVAATLPARPLAAVELAQRDGQSESPSVETFKRRMLLWDNPVEFVNNMYSCHPGPSEDKKEYFEEVFG